MRRTLFLPLLLLCGALPVVAAPAATIEVLPRHPTTVDPIELIVDGDPERCWPASLDWQPPQLDDQRVVLSASASPGPLPPSCNFPGPHRIAIAPLAAGFYSAEFRILGEVLGAAVFEVREPQSEAVLRAGRFVVSASFQQPAGTPERAATAVTLGEESAHFWFFTPRNVELTFKILDGRGVNGAFWIFIASMTDVAYSVRVIDTALFCGQPGCNELLYQSAAGQNRNFIDTSAFAQ